MPLPWKQYFKKRSGERCLPYLSCLSYYTIYLSMIFHDIPCHCILFQSILFYPILFQSILFYPILLFSILFYPILSYSILFYSILFYSILSILFVLSFSVYLWINLSSYLVYVDPALLVKRIILLAQSFWGRFEGCPDPVHLAAAMAPSRNLSHIIVLSVVLLRLPHLLPFTWSVATKSNQNPSPKF